ncbi:Repeat domain-containing protein [Bacteroides clarus YIT 12056]|uniref:FG-GAP repeat protein n=1 Tax=Bacteroides clarus YIT 12056 TaxID=762984 RepID=A0ABP2KS08_9BACE|nr:FG-GAP-like repeat-containing protein [Bacteroides clarus]EGF51396.1 FG-GAP repeat protein [Bacteroides clarus YIT 12056]SHG93465.1 Repeat domain-containing protein [Bacteroides clarus YIT 12056]
MRSVYILILLFVASWAYSHDDVAYRTSKGWFIDFNNDSSIDKSLPRNFSEKEMTFFADYDGDGFLDLCEVKVKGNNLEWSWFIKAHQGDFKKSVTTVFGTPQEQCLVGDFNGDGKTDIAVITSNGDGKLEWSIDYSPCDGVSDISGSSFGQVGDKVLAGDFNADGVDDLCIYRPGTSQWFVSLSDLVGKPSFSSPYAIDGLIFGTPYDIPLVGDFNGDGYDDMAVYRPKDNKIYINYFSPDKPKMEGYGNIHGKGEVNQSITCPVKDILGFTIADFNYSRPQVLPLATKQALGKKVNLRHGWTCIFDESLDVDKWIEALKALGINTLEYHPWMRAHEENAMIGSSWNTYVGDDRLWTSKAKMLEKIRKFQAIGGRNICYNAIYASSPAFAHNHPEWAIRNPENQNFFMYGENYLYLMGINQNINHSYTINGKSFRNFNDYLKDQAEMAQLEFNWDGWRWDWYGLPDVYECNALSGKGDISHEISVLTDTLNTHVKQIRPDVTTTTLQLPYANNNIPFEMTAAVVDHQFLEIWPEAWGTGDRYSQMYDVMYKAKSKYPDKPLFANFYPPTAMKLTASWPQANIRYQFATCLAAGTYPAAQVVDGIAGFTDPVPFHATKYPKEVLTEISKWNRFAEAYGGYFYYSNPVYLFRDIRESRVSVKEQFPGLVIKAKERIDKRTRRIDALVINLINYGVDELKWTEVNFEPQTISATVDFQLPQGLKVHKAYYISPEGKMEIPLNRNGRSYQAIIPQLSLFGSLVVTTNRNRDLPEVPKDYARSFPDYEFTYDSSGSTLSKGAKEIIVLDEEIPLPIDNYYNGKLSTWELSEDAYKGNTSIKVTPEKLYITSTSKSAIRVPIEIYKNFEIAIKSNEASATWFGFRLLKPSETSPIWEAKNIFYRVGTAQADTPCITLTENEPKLEWTVFKRNIYNDIINHPEFTGEWSNAIVTAILLGPIEGNSANFDDLRFIRE